VGTDTLHRISSVPDNANPENLGHGSIPTTSQATQQRQSSRLELRTKTLALTGADRAELSGNVVANMERPELGLIAYRSGREGLGQFGTRESRVQVLGHWEPKRSLFNHYCQRAWKLRALVALKLVYTVQVGVYSRSLYSLPPQTPLTPYCSL
jgi:hypothetical protein